VEKIEVGKNKNTWIKKFKFKFKFKKNKKIDPPKNFKNAPKKDPHRSLSKGNLFLFPKDQLPNN
jgi:hypothetical protein